MGSKAKYIQSLEKIQLFLDQVAIPIWIKWVNNPAKHLLKCVVHMDLFLYLWVGIKKSILFFRIKIFLMLTKVINYIETLRPCFLMMLTKIIKYTQIPDS